ncbi:hypothetical protein [Streptomyces sp. NPDC047014]|uniref:hypothetical protein n=1 Tax=Streptomyces sp. NPDC047014 TaxID=3155736 RepID=UPI00340D5659
MVDVDAVTSELYGLRPEEFTAARDARAAEARAAGERAQAKRIAALRRPTLAVWAANLLARAEQDQARRLLELGEGLREAHRTLAGEELRTLSHQQHVVVAAMAREACRLAGEAGRALSESVRHEVEQILRTVLADPATATTWIHGTLTEPPPPTGFAVPEPPPGTRKPDPPDAGAAARAAEEALALAEAERTRTRAALKAADTEIATLRSRLTEAEGARALLAEAAEAAETAHAQATAALKRPDAPPRTTPAPNQAA